MEQKQPSDSIGDGTTNADPLKTNQLNNKYIIIIIIIIIKLVQNTTLIKRKAFCDA